MDTKPEFLKVGALVKVQHWYGQVVDLAESSSGVMVRVASPKALWRYHSPEWLEFDPTQIKPATREEAAASCDLYIERVVRTLHSIEEMKAGWCATV